MGAPLELNRPFCNSSAAALRKIDNALLACENVMQFSALWRWNNVSAAAIALHQDRRPVAMTDVQKEALALLAEVWDLSPDVRLGQLMAHLGFLGEAHIERGLGYIEDDELIAILYRHRAELLARLQGTPNQAPQPTGAAVSVSGSSTLPAPAAKL